MVRTMSAKSGRNYGIDLLRLIAMFLIVLCHCFNQGGIVGASSGAGLTAATFTRNNLALYGTNLFALISGFVGYREEEKRFRYAGFLKFWLPVVFYSFGIALLSFFLRPGTIPKRVLLLYLLPISTNKYWYVTAYAAVFFAAPWINRLFRSCTEIEANRLAVTVLFVFVVYPYITRVFVDVFTIKAGYTALWLCILYMLGAWMKKNGLTSAEYRKRWAALLLASLLFQLIVQIFRFFLEKSITVERTDLSMLLISLSVVGLFASVQPGQRAVKLIRFFSPAAFGVYLIHVHPIVFERELYNAFAFVGSAPVWLIPFAALGCAFGVFFVCLLIEKLRLLLFRLLRIDALCDRLIESVQPVEQTT